MSHVAILSPGESLTAVMSGAASTVNPHYSAEWRQANSSEASQPVGTLAGATAVTLVSNAAADANGPKIVESVRVFNADDAAVTVTIAKGSYTMCKITLQAGDMLIFDERGLIVLDDAGQAKSVAGA
jgi:hypothetical protein